MVIRIGLLFWVVGALYGCGCDSDVYGSSMDLIVEVRTLPDQDTFQIGDTLLLHILIDKNVNVLGHDQPIYLEDFNFFTKVGISEIADTIEKFCSEIKVMSDVGQINVNPMGGGVISYPLAYEESEDAYAFEGSFILAKTGLFHFRLSTRESLFDHYEHPALYACDDVKRKNIGVCYYNTSTTKDRFQDLFLKTKVDYLLELIDFDRYERLGAHTFFVVDK